MRIFFFEFLSIYNFTIFDVEQNNLTLNTNKYVSDPWVNLNHAVGIEDHRLCKWMLFIGLMTADSGPAVFVYCTGTSNRLSVGGGSQDVETFTWVFKVKVEDYLSERTQIHFDLIIPQIELILPTSCDFLHFSDPILEGILYLVFPLIDDIDPIIIRIGQHQWNIKDHATHFLVRYVFHYSLFITHLQNTYFVFAIANHHVMQQLCLRRRPLHLLVYHNKSVIETITSWTHFQDLRQVIHSVNAIRCDLAFAWTFQCLKLHDYELILKPFFFCHLHVCWCCFYSIFSGLIICFIWKLNIIQILHTANIILAVYLVRRGNDNRLVYFHIFESYQAQFIQLYLKFVVFIDDIIIK